MKVDPIVLATILSMAVVTYATRVGGFLLLSRLSLTGRLSAWLHYVPGAVLVAIIAPSVLPAGLLGSGAGESGTLTAGPAEALAGMVAVVVAARSRNLLLTTIAGVASVWVLRQVIEG